MKEIEKGEIWYAVLDGAVGSEQGKSRYCVVVQNDKANNCSTTTIVCPITSREKDYGLTHVFIDCLKLPSYIECEQIRVIDKKRLKRKIAKLNQGKISEVEDKLRLQLGL